MMSLSSNNEIDFLINKNKDEKITTITELGKLMACFPVNPRYAKMLALAIRLDDSNKEKNRIISYVICLISALTVSELFLDGETTLKTNETTSTSTSTSKSGEQQHQQQQSMEEMSVKLSDIRKSWLTNGFPGSNIKCLGDFMVFLIALGATEFEEFKSQLSSVEHCPAFLKFCHQYGLRYKAVIEARKLRVQLTNTVNFVMPHLNLLIDPKMEPPSDEHAKLLRQIILSGSVDRIARKHSHVVKNAQGVELKNAYQSLTLDEPLFIHPSSVLFKELPEYVCYTEVAETSKCYMKSLCAIESKWLPIYLADQCSFEKPIEIDDDNDDSTYGQKKQQKPRYDAKRGRVMCHRRSTFGPFMWPISEVECEFPMSMELYKYFAKFILEGQVIRGLAAYNAVLLASPLTILKSWAK